MNRGTVPRPNLDFEEGGADCMAPRFAYHP